MAITFDPHPLQVLLPGGIKLISTCEQKIELIEMAGIDVLLIIPFTKEFAKTSAEEFVSRAIGSKTRRKRTGSRLRLCLWQGQKRQY